MTSKNEELTKTNLNLEGTLKANANEIKHLKQEIEILKINLNQAKEANENIFAEKLNEAEEVSRKNFEILINQEREQMKQEILVFKNEIEELNCLKFENNALKQKLDEYNNLQQSNPVNNKIYDYQLNIVKNENDALQKEVEELKLKLDDLIDENTSLKINLSEQNSAKELNDKIKNLSKLLEVYFFYLIIK